MKKNYILLFIAFVFSAQFAKAQCPTASGMIVTPVTFGTSCFLNIQFAIANSDVSVYNASGYVANGTASASGNIFLLVPCGSGPYTSIVSVVTTPAVQICNTFVMTSAATLPIKLVSFAGTVTGNKTVLLKWVTSLELNRDRYEIEKSTDGVIFTKVGTLTPDAVGLGERTYNYEDVTFSAGATAFYRLKEVDADGKATYSKTIYLNDKTLPGSDYSLFPNPVTPSNNSIQIKGLASADVNTNNIRVVDLTGRNIAFRITGGNSIELASGVPSGIYLVKVKDRTIKLVKQ